MRRVILVMGIALGTAMNGKAQITASNPLEWMALAEGNELLEKQIDSQINGQKKTAILQNTIAAEFNQMHKWQKQYNSYLKDVSGYASSLKALNERCSMNDIPSICMLLTFAPNSTDFVSLPLTMGRT